MAAGNGMFADPKVSIVAALVLGILMVVGVYAMVSSGDIHESVASYYRCPSCSTVVPCPVNGDGLQKPCPSCGMVMDIIKKGAASARQLVQAGPTGKNLVCPSCWTVVPHLPGAAVFNQTCPKCGVAMRRQLPAQIPTAFRNRSQLTGAGSIRQVALGQTAPQAMPITMNAVMPHSYRGVCSKCHPIVGAQKNFSTGQAGVAAALPRPNGGRFGTNARGLTPVAANPALCPPGGPIGGGGGYSARLGGVARLGPGGGVLY